MFDWALWLGFGILLLLSLVFVIYPLRKLKPFAILMVAFYMGTVIFMYQYWGGLSQWQAYQQKLAHAQMIKKLAAQYNTPNQLIKKLRSQLDNTLKSAQGWYLLGKLYAAQGKWRDAHRAFAKALAFKPENEQYAVQEIYARWILNHQRLNDALRARLKTMHVHYPNQPDVVMILAMDAFETQHYQQAIDYWNILLPQTPAGSKVRLQLQEAIAKASARL